MPKSKAPRSGTFTSKSKSARLQQQQTRLSLSAAADEQPQQRTAREQAAAAPSSSSEQHTGDPRAYDVGEESLIHADVADPVGLVGCQITVHHGNLGWANKKSKTKSSKCRVDAYTAHRPDGPAYVVSWVSAPDIHYVVNAMKLVECNHLCSQSATTAAKLAGHSRLLSSS
jgi:hypothetical protein